MDTYEKRPVKIKGWEMYQVDTDGNVYAKNGKILKWSHNHSGYRMVNFYHNHTRKGFAIHTLVAETFLEHDTTHNQVNHIDGDKDNNCVENLEWATPKENTKHSIEVLGNDFSGANNCNAKHIYGYDKNTHELIYFFPSLIDAGHYFSPDDPKKARHIQNIISQINTRRGAKKSYRGCVWTTNPIT